MEIPKRQQLHIFVTVNKSNLRPKLTKHESIRIVLSNNRLKEHLFIDGRWFHVLLALNHTEFPLLPVVPVVRGGVVVCCSCQL